MLRGVYIDVPPTTPNTLWQVLKCISIEQYSWYNIESQNEVWVNFRCSDDFFTKDYYNGKEFKKLIHSDHYIIFLKLQAYFESGEFFDIRTYEEFLASDCQILLLINDTEFIEIYAKDQQIIHEIYNNALAIHCKDVSYIDDSNDIRKKMYVI